LTFLKQNMSNLNPSQGDIAPAYLAMLHKAVKAYCRKKDEKMSSSHHSSSTVSDFLPSMGEELPSPTTDTPVGANIKLVPPQPREEGGECIPTPCQGGGYNPSLSK
jgi:hypothetical protein